MNTWHTTFLDPHTRILVHEGLLVEYAPGHVLESNLAAYPQFRAAAIAALTPAGHTAIARTALWIHTGLLFDDRMPALHTSHPTSSKPPVISRRTISSSCLQHRAGARFTSPECTAVDLLLLEDKEHAKQAIRELYQARLLTLSDITAHLKKEQSRNGARKAARIFEELLAEKSLI